MNNTITRYEYRISVSRYTVDGHTYTTYGISVYQEACSDTPCRLMRDIPHISSSLLRVSELAERCNRLQPSPIHLDDIIEDCLP